MKINKYQNKEQTARPGYPSIKPHKPISRRFRQEYKAESHYPAGGDWHSLLEDEPFFSCLKYDALGRVSEEKQADGSLTQPQYHQSGRLNKVKVRLKGESEWSDFVTGITYNARGQREKISYGNNSETTYSYEKTTYRLTSLVTRRNSDQKVLQSITYIYDPVGNRCKITDDSHEKVFHNNHAVDPVQHYTYDALYRLTRANGREHTGLNGPDYYKNPASFKQSAFINLENQNDQQKLANYLRKYSYDRSGNLHRIRHIASDSQRSFTREIAVDQSSNKAVLKENNKPVDFAQHFDYNGNCIRLEHLRKLNWNYRDNISSAVLIERENQVNDAEYYVYDASGQRVRKVSQRLINGRQIESEEKLYLGSVEIKRIRQQHTLILERSTLHVMDEQSRIAVVHHWERDQLKREIENESWLGSNRARYQYGNHLGSASLETDSKGRIVSYEEYFVYGGTSFIAGKSQKEAKLKEYRYSGKERDDLTGLYYYGARYYASWLGRWLSCDPLLEQGGTLNLYQFCRCNAVNNIDPDGRKDRNKNAADFDITNTELDFNKIFQYLDESGQHNLLNLLEKALTSSDIYDDSLDQYLKSKKSKKYTLPQDSYISRLSDDEIAAAGMNPGLFKDEESGFFAGLYYNKRTDEYIVAYRGTEGSVRLNGQKQAEAVKDWHANFIQSGGGEANQYTQAMNLAEYVKKKLGDQVRFTGHSLGGGLAAAAGIVTGTGETATFNAAGLHRRTIRRHMKRKSNSGSPGRWESRDLIEPYHVKGDIVTRAQRGGKAFLIALSCFVPGLAAAVVPFSAGGISRGIEPADRSKTGEQRHQMSEMIDSLLKEHDVINKMNHYYQTQ